MCRRGFLQSLHASLSRGVTVNIIIKQRVCFQTAKISGSQNLGQAAVHAGIACISVRVVCHAKLTKAERGHLVSRKKEWRFDPQCGTSRGI